MNAHPRKNRWPLASAEGRWKGFGPYYAMFPVDFASEHIERYSNVGDTIIDPFCGRGTSNYVANLLGRDSVGCDLNPVAWVYSKAKTDPARRVGELLRRVDEVWDARHASDVEAGNSFQALAWAPIVLSFLNSARRELDWRNSKVDWTLTAIILVYLHAKLGGGLSNQMRQCKSMSPEYAVRWWKARSLQPPALNPVEFIKGRIRWRYQKGVYEKKCESRIYLGDARKKLKGLSMAKASLLITSPPYSGITNYEYDNWIRLWLLGGPDWPNWGQGQKYGNKKAFRSLIEGVFRSARRHLVDDACVVVRTDRRKFTLETTAYALSDLWPDHRLYGRADIPGKPTQTALFGDRSFKPGEIDLLALPRGEVAPIGFLDLAA